MSNDSKRISRLEGINDELRDEDNKFVITLIEEKLKEIYDLTFLLLSDRNGMTSFPLISIKSYIRMAYDEVASLMKDSEFRFKGRKVPTFQEIYTQNDMSDETHEIVNKLRKAKECI